MSVVKQWVWLSRRKDLDPARIGYLLCFFRDAGEIFDCNDRARLRELELSDREIKSLLDKDLADAERICAACREKNISVLTLQDAAYPAKLRAIPDAPPVLYVRGTLPPLDDHLTVAVIGSRKPSPYGLSMTAAFSARLAKAGAIVVSGMARGVDSDAARAVMREGKPTVAVLGCGPDICYPASSRDVFDRICEHGAIISEYPPGTEVQNYYFPARNRIISGLSDGVLVMEAAAKSGTIITADAALEQGREVFCLPGNVDSPTSAGCNRLISEGAAKAVMRPWDVLCEFTDRYDDIDPAEQEAEFTLSVRPRPSEPLPDVSPVPPPEDVPLPTDLQGEDRKLAEIVSRGRCHVDDLIRESGIPAARVLTRLTMLEMQGIVRALPGKYYEIKH